MTYDAMAEDVKHLLDENGIAYTVVEYLKETPDAQQLAVILTRLGKRPLEVMRTGEARFSELGLSVEDDRTDEEWIRLMVDNPILIERPIVVNEQKAALGRPVENILNII